jgi:TATA-box binding protein (TBP) (component of TFIID and TFIIIB)
MSDNDNNEKQKEVSNTFVKSIKTWVTLDDRMMKLKEELKTIGNEKKEFEKVILEELDKMDEKVISISDGKIRKSICKSQTPLKKEHFQKTLFDLTKDEKKTFDIIQNMMKSRQVVEKVNLKRIKNKESVIKKS